MLPRWVDVLQLPRGVGNCGIGIFPLLLALEKEWGEFCSFPASRVGIPARNPGIVGKEGPRLGLAHIWEGDDPQQLQSTPEIVEFGKGDTSHDHREEKDPRWPE